MQEQTKQETYEELVERIGTELGYAPSEAKLNAGAETTIKTKPSAKHKSRRNPSDRGTRGIINKINRKLAEPGLSNEEFERYVQYAVQLRKTLGIARNAKDGTPSANRGPDSLF